jgi:hypothetical protein
MTVDAFEKELSSDLFLLLTLGLAEHQEFERASEYPPRLLQSLNRLAVLMQLHSKNIPTTVPEFLRLFEQPLASWWPLEGQEQFQKDDIMGELPLLYDGRLHSQVNDYLRDNQRLSLVGQSTAFIRQQLDQEPIEEMVRLARIKPERFAEDYTRSRRFMVELPYTNEEQLLSFVGTLTDEFRQQMLRVYEKPQIFDAHARFEGHYWVCPYCGGLLNWRAHIPYCVKPDVCAALSNNYEQRKAIETHWSIRRLRPGILARTTIPGIPELKLFQMLSVLATQMPEQFETPSLYPGGDRYDIRLVLRSGQVLAIDLKDQASPYQLAKRLKEEWPQQLRNRENSQFGWTNFYYVVPDHRPSFVRHYIEYAQDIFSETNILTLSSFYRLVLAKVKEE